MSKEMSAKVQKTQSHTQLHLKPLYMTIAIVRRARIWKTAAILKDNKMTVSVATVSRVYWIKYSYLCLRFFYFSLNWNGSKLTKFNSICVLINDGIISLQWTWCIYSPSIGSCFWDSVWQTRQVTWREKMHVMLSKWSKVTCQDKNVHTVKRTIRQLKGHMPVKGPYTS